MNTRIQSQVFLIFSVIGICTTMLSCSNSSPYTRVEKQYTGAFIRNAVIGYCFPRSELSIYNEADVRVSLGKGDPRDGYRNFFESSFQK